MGRFFITVLIFVCLFLSSSLADICTDNNYIYSRNITTFAPSGSAALEAYTSSACGLNTATLIDDSKLLQSGNNSALYYNSTRIDFLWLNQTWMNATDTVGVDSSSSCIYYRVQANISSGSNDTQYTFCYGNTSITNQNSSFTEGQDIFLAYDDFGRASGTVLGNNWSEVGGDLNINQSKFLGGASVQAKACHNFSNRDMVINEYILYFSANGSGENSITLANSTSNANLGGVNWALLNHVVTPTTSFYHENGTGSLSSSTLMTLSATSFSEFSSRWNGTLGDMYSKNGTTPIVWNNVNGTQPGFQRYNGLCIIPKGPGDFYDNVTWMAFWIPASAHSFGSESSANSAPSFLGTNVSPVRAFRSSQVFNFSIIANDTDGDRMNVTFNIRSAIGNNTNVTTNNLSTTQFNGTINLTGNTTYWVSAVFIESGTNIITTLRNMVFRLFSSAEFFESMFERNTNNYSFSEDSTQTQLNISINKNATVSLISFNVSATPYENRSEFLAGGLDSWTCFPTTATSLNNCTSEDGRVYLFARGNAPIVNARIVKAFNFSNYDKIIISYNITEVEDGLFLGFGDVSTVQSSGVASNITATGVGTLEYEVSNRSGISNITIGVSDNGTLLSTTAFINSVRLVSFSRNIVVDIGNFSGGDELQIPGSLVESNNIQLQELNDSRSYFNFTFRVRGNQTLGVAIPLNAQLSLATMNISGFNDSMFYDPTSQTVNSTLLSLTFVNNSQPGSSTRADVILNIDTGAIDPNVAHILGPNACVLSISQARGISIPSTNYAINCDSFNNSQMNSTGIVINSTVVACVRLNNSTGFTDDNVRVRVAFSNVSGSCDTAEYNFTVYNNTGFEYPINLSLDVGNNNVNEWSFSGNYSQTNNKTLNFSTQISNYLATCTYDSDNICDVPLRFYSDGRGTVGITELYVNYTNATFIPNFENITNDYIRDQCNTSGYNCSLPIRFSYTRAGNISLQDVEIVYSVPEPILTLETPNEGQRYNTTTFELNFTRSNFTAQTCKYSLQYNDTLTYEVRNQSISCIENRSITTSVGQGYILWLHHQDSFLRESTIRRNITTLVVPASSGSGDTGGGGAPEDAVGPVVCGDGRCERSRGESFITCAPDCGGITGESIAEALSEPLKNPTFLKMLIFFIIPASILILLFWRDKKKKKKDREGKEDTKENV